MAAIDFFCAADDRHRVILLVDLLEKAGLSVVLRSEPQAEPTRPCLVACTRRAFRERWICDLFTRTRQVAALRLDDAPLPGPAAQIVDLQTWPARSADRHVGPLVDWLEGGAPEPERFGPGAAAMAGFDPALRSGSASLRKIRARLGDSNLGGFLVLAALIGGAAALLNLVEPERRAPPPAPAAELPVAQSSLEAGAGMRVRAGAALHEGDEAPLPGVAGFEPAAALGGLLSDAAAPRGAKRTAPAAPSDPPAVGVRRARLSYLCEPRALAAAKAWGGVLHWTAATPPFDRACAEPA